MPMMTPSKTLAIPLALFAAFMLYWAFTYDDEYSKYVIFPVIMLGVIYVLSPQLDWWWYQRFPPDVPEPIRAMLEERFEPYQRFSGMEKDLFRQKTAMFRMNIEFKGPAFDDKISEDIQFIVAANAVLLTRHKASFLLPKFNVTVIYPGPFPSPQYPMDFHASELFEEDGVLIFSAQHLIKGFFEPTQYYNVGLHEWARGFLLSYPDLPWPSGADSDWERLTQVSGFQKDALFAYINRPDVELLPAAMVHFFHFPEAFREILPDYAALFERLFNQPGD